MSRCLYIYVCKHNFSLSVFTFHHTLVLTSSHIISHHKVNLLELLLNGIPTISNCQHTCDILRSDDDNFILNNGIEKVIKMTCVVNFPQGGSKTSTMITSTPTRDAVLSSLFPVCSSSLPWESTIV